MIREHIAGEFASTPSGTPQIDYGSNGRVWVNSDFNSTADLNIGSAISNIQTTNATEFISSYTVNGSFQSGFALKGSASTGESTTAVDALPNGNVLVAGVFSGTIDLDPSSNNTYFTCPSDTNAFIASFDSAGGLIWANHIRGLACVKAIKGAPSGDVFVTGYFAGTTYFDMVNNPTVYHQLPGGGLDLFLIKYNASGVLQWIHRFGSTNSDKGKHLEIDQNGNVIIGGTFATLIDFDPAPGTTFNLTTPQNFIQCFVAKYDANGNFIHAFKIVAEDLMDLCTDNNNNIIVSGIMVGFGNFNVAGGNAIVYCVDGAFDADNYLAKYDSAGNYLWAFGLGNTVDNYSCNSIATDNAGNIFFAANFGPSSDTIDIDPGPNVFFVPGAISLLIKYNPSGNLLWGTKTGILGEVHLAVDNNGNPTFVSGYYPNQDLDPGPATVIPVSSFDSFLLARYSTVGQYLGHNYYSATASNYSLGANCISLNDSNHLVLGGFFNGNLNFDNTPGNQNILLNSGGNNDYNGFLLSLDQSNYLAKCLPLRLS
jgi:hypothetical protein